MSYEPDGLQKQDIEYMKQQLLDAHIGFRYCNRGMHLIATIKGVQVHIWPTTGTFRVPECALSGRSSKLAHIVKTVEDCQREHNVSG